MKLFHISDLHIGKQLNGYSLKENQEAVLSQIVQAAREHRPDAVLICGDIYDKSVPSGEAFTVFDGFLNGLASIEPRIPVLIIAGNHDSPERLQFAKTFLERARIYLSVMPPGESGEGLRKIVLQDAYGPVNFYLLPFLKPGYVRHLSLKGEGFDGYESALRHVLEEEDIDWEQRNILLSHQFYVAKGQETKVCDSEQAVITVGGLDHIHASLVERFDYVALGHLHGAQQIGSGHIRYCGSPYKYSVSEEHQIKGILMAELGQKGEELKVEVLPLHGIQDVRRERGTLEEVLKRADEKNRHDFVSIVITDEREPYHLREQLEEVYDHMLELKIDNARTRSRLLESGEEIPVLHPMEAFGRFYEAVRHSAMTQEEELVMHRLVEEAKEDDR